MIEPFTEATEEQIEKLRHAVNFFTDETFRDLEKWIHGEELDEAASWIAKRSIDEVIAWVDACAWHDHDPGETPEKRCVACDMGKPW